MLSSLFANEIPPIRPARIFALGILVVLWAWGGSVAAQQDSSGIPPTPPSTEIETIPAEIEQSAPPEAPPKDPDDPFSVPPPTPPAAPLDDEFEWLQHARAGYENGFVIASDQAVNLNASDAAFRLSFNGWGQLRHTYFASDGQNMDLNQFQLKRGRLLFSGHAFKPTFLYYVQLDGRSSSGDNVRLLDYYLTYDFGYESFGLEKGRLGFRVGKYKMPGNLARSLSGRQFEFADRSVASTFFDINRSFAWGLYGGSPQGRTPWFWETAIFNGLVTGGAETGSSGTLDNNFAYSARIVSFPRGNWGEGELADFDIHETLATRSGCGFAATTIDSFGTTEFDALRAVDCGNELSSLFAAANLPITQYSVVIFSIDHSFKYRGWSGTMEYYFRNVSGFEGADLPNLFDHGFWLQLGKFAIPEKLQFLARWSRVQGNSGTLGNNNLSSDEIAGGVVWYFRGQNAKLTVDLTHLNGAPIDSAALDISPGDMGWLLRTQLQFAF